MEPNDNPAGSPEPLDYSYSPNVTPTQESSPDRDLLEIHAPSEASMEASFLTDREITHKDKVTAATHLLISLSLSESNSENSDRSISMIDDASSLLEAIILQDDLASIRELQDIKLRANIKQSPKVIESFVAFVLDPQKASRQVARTAVASIGIMLLSSPSIPPSIDGSLATQVRRTIVSEQVKRYCQKDSCSASLVHMNYAISKFVTQSSWPSNIKPNNLRPKLWSCKDHPAGKGCDCTTMCCVDLVGNCSTVGHVECNSDHLDYSLSRQLMDALKRNRSLVTDTFVNSLPSSSDEPLIAAMDESDPLMVSNPSSEIINIDDDAETTNSVGSSGRLTADCLSTASSVWHKVNPRPDTPLALEDGQPPVSESSRPSQPGQPSVPESSRPSQP